jgi:hypothetical protein
LKRARRMRKLRVERMEGAQKKKKLTRPRGLRTRATL